MLLRILHTGKHSSSCVFLAIKVIMWWLGIRRATRGTALLQEWFKFVIRKFSFLEAMLESYYSLKETEKLKDKEK
jgi:hypothetical protein